VGGRYCLGCVELSTEGERGWGSYEVMFRMVSNNRLGNIVWSSLR
jgi:hypothetical protein